MPVEIELKFPVASPAALATQLAGLGCTLVTPRTFESNLLLDTPDRAILNARQLLRLRRYGNTWTLTHKLQPADSHPDDARYKRRIETETTVADGPAILRIFASLGYAPVFRYEKFRTEFAAPPDPAAPHAHIVLDETPIGAFAELEGPPEWIDSMLARLGVPHSACTTESYGKLFLAWKARTNSPAEHLTFDVEPTCGRERSVSPQAKS